MTTLATSPVESPDTLALVADQCTPLGRSAAARFHDACLAEALTHDGRVDPNAVRERLLVGGVLDIEPRQYSALWSTACAAGGFLVKTDELVPISGEGSRHNGGKSIRVRRWVGPMTPAAGADLGKAKSVAGQTPEGEVAPGAPVGGRPVSSDHSSPSGTRRPLAAVTASHGAHPASVVPSPVTEPGRFPAGRQGAAHAYGPHDPASAPTTIALFCNGQSHHCMRKGCSFEVVDDMPVVLRRQRERLNDLAHAAAQRGAA